MGGCIIIPIGYGCNGNSDAAVDCACAAASVAAEESAAAASIAGAKCAPIGNGGSGPAPGGGINAPMLPKNAAAATGSSSAGGSPCVYRARGPGDR